MKKQIKVMRGIPGSGKSTYAKQLAHEAAQLEQLPIICSADEYFMQNGTYQFDATKLGEAHKYCLRKFMLMLEDRMYPIIVDNTNINIEDIAPYVAVGEAYDYEVEIIQVNTEPGIAGSRNVHGVPVNKVMDMHRRLTRMLLPKRFKVTHITQ